MQRPITISKTGITVLSFIFLQFVGVTDFLTGAELSFSIFYLLPILAVTWFVSATVGLVFSILGAITWGAWEIVSHPAYSHFLIPYWNAFVRLSFFVLFTYLLSWVRQSLEIEKDLARTDTLTGAENSRSFLELADREIERATRHRRPITVVYLDLDNFKHVNDTLGHTEGDRLLSSVASTILGNIRKIDVLSRLGGDEFALLLPETGKEDAETLMARIKESLVEIMENNEWPVTFSIGIAVFNSPPKSVANMIREADSLMYHVKKNGKNSTEIHEF